MIKLNDYLIKNRIIPILITCLQTVGILHLWYAYPILDGHFPASFIALHMLVVANLIVLIYSCFSFFKTSNKTNLWLLPIALAVLLILLLLCCYLVMGIDK